MTNAGPANGDFIRITNREIYDTLRAVQGGVEDIRHQLNGVVEENIELRRRVRALELKVYTILAGFTTALAAGGLAALNGAFR